ncbi:MAG: cell division protein ZapE [Woeseia sp.]|nr:AFG1 family ATPase [Woeseia sp.]MBT8097705.1 AFG1 family ATPase [Woeseia sp.]NNE59985.1 cell division protein ZapE [Woeseia sp.]NNL55560.1 cell division protein ZapE [Woeseia sp.]
MRHMKKPSLSEIYAKQPGLQEDPEQLAIVILFEALQRALTEESGFLSKVRGNLPFLPRPAVPRGIYLWGGVGRGKTFLMDLFFDTLNHKKKKRIHFHRMMRDVHHRLGLLEDERDPLDLVASQYAREAHVLCFDEFFVSDIGDAMILGRLLDGLFSRGVTLVTTSNLPPDQLYAGGLQRERFLPAIELLKTHTQVIALDGANDYRLRLLQRAGTYLTPPGPDTDERLMRFFKDVAPGKVVESRRIDINGRTVETLRAAKGVAWFDFAELCEGPRSHADYIEIARWNHTVIVSGVPQLDAQADDAARRFIALVDEFYDRRVKLVLAAATRAAELYTGNRLKFEFQRTISRLTEMQSQEYLHAPHRA